MTISKSFATMDIETISLKDFDNIQIPILISTTFNLKHTHLIEIDRERLIQFVKEKDLDSINELILNM